MWNWLQSRRCLILKIGALRDALHELAQDLHWTHGMLATFGTCEDLKCRRAREIHANIQRNLEPYGREINKSVNLWNDNDKLRTFIRQLRAQIEQVDAETVPKIWPAFERLRVLAANPPFALEWGEKPHDERKKRYG